MSIHAPAWGATSDYRGEICLLLISIHAPRVGRDRSFYRLRTFGGHFNPRAPHGARLMQTCTGQSYVKFQSTRPAWGRDQNIQL